MFKDEEISEKVAEYLVLGEREILSFCHLIKTHKIPHYMPNPSEWLQSQGLFFAESLLMKNLFDTEFTQEMLFEQRFIDMDKTLTST